MNLSPDQLIEGWPDKIVEQDTDPLPTIPCPHCRGRGVLEPPEPQESKPAKRTRRQRRRR